MNVEIYDNLLLPEDYQRLYETMYSNRFPWFYSNGKSFLSEHENNKQIFQFTHHFYGRHTWQSQFVEIIEPILKFLSPVAIFKIKANLTTITPTKLQYSYHRDSGANLLQSKTACYYVNTNNGSTVFVDGQEIESVANRLIVFDSNRLHTGTSCTDESTRCVINFNYFKSNV